MTINKIKNSLFRCFQCKEWVNLDKQMGTAHRNHCPFCLWSKHVDDKNAGDRKSRCKGAMIPIGLTFKKGPPSKYGPPRPGELMIIHECTQCGAHRINRIAADDCTEVILAVLDQSAALGKETRQKLEEDGIHPLTEADRPEVRTQLFGKSV